MKIKIELELDTEKDTDMEDIKAMLTSFKNYVEKLEDTTNEKSRNSVAGSRTGHKREPL
jgi:hypothetical protein